MLNFISLTIKGQSPFHDQGSLLTSIALHCQTINVTWLLPFILTYDCNLPSPNPFALLYNVTHDLAMVIKPAYPTVGLLLPRGVGKIRQNLMANCWQVLWTELENSIVAEGNSAAKESSYWGNLEAWLPVKFWTLVHLRW